MGSWRLPGGQHSTWRATTVSRGQDVGANTTTALRLPAITTTAHNPHAHTLDRRQQGWVGMDLITPLRRSGDRKGQRKEAHPGPHPKAVVPLHEPWAAERGERRGEPHGLPEWVDMTSTTVPRFIFFALYFYHVLRTSVCLASIHRTYSTLLSSHLQFVSIRGGTSTGIGDFARFTHVELCCCCCSTSAG